MVVIIPCRAAARLIDWLGRTTYALHPKLISSDGSRMRLNAFFDKLKYRLGPLSIIICLVKRGIAFAGECVGDGSLFSRVLELLRPSLPSRLLRNTKVTTDVASL